MSAWAGIDERDDHYLGLAGANVVATGALLVLRDNGPACWRPRR